MPKLCDYLGPFEAMNSQQSREFFAWQFGVENSFLCLCVLYSRYGIYASCMDDVLEYIFQGDTF